MCELVPTITTIVEISMEVSKLIKNKCYHMIQLCSSWAFTPKLYFLP